MFKTTNQDVLTFLQAANAWLERDAKTDQEAGRPPQDTKFKVALRKVGKRATRVLEAFNEAVEDLNNDYAAERTKDKWGNDLKVAVIERDEAGRLVFSREGTKARTAAYRKLVKAEVSIEPYIAFPPSLLPDAEAEAFEGFVLPKPEEDEPSPEEESIH